MEAWRNELYHHGILGMKWGKKNGPPYPLGASDHSASEKKAGYKKSLGGGRNENLYNRKSARYRKAAEASKRDAEDLKKHGYVKEADAVMKVSKKNKEKADKIDQKTNYKQIKRSYSKSKDPSRPYLTDQKTQELIRSKANIKKEDINKLKELKEKWLEAENATEDFYDSKECEQATERAYQKTLKYFKESDPSYLKEIIANNKGSTAGLDSFHDFRKVFEGYEDDEWSKAKSKWNKTDKAKSRKQADQLWEQYFRANTELGNKATSEILGEYGNKKLNKLQSETYNDLIRQEVDSLINELTANKKHK